MNDHSIRRPLVLAAVAGMAGAALLALDGGALAAPHSWTLQGWTELIEERGPASAAMTALRLAAMTAAGYLLILGAVTSLVRLARVRWLDALLAFATPRVLRPLLGIVTVATFAAPAAAGAADTVSTPPVMVLVGSEATATTTSSSTITTSSPGRTPSDPPTMRRVDAPTTTSAVTTSTSTTTTTPARTVTVTTAAPAVVSTPVPKATAPERPSTWTIGRGEHLWHVAETVMRDERGTAPTDEQVTAYWRTLIDANHDRLVDPDNPDLVFTGQELLLPPL